MSISIEVARRDEAVLVTLGGAAHADLLVTVGDGVAQLLEDGDTLIVDLDGLTLLDGDALSGFIACLDAASERRGEVRLAVRRSSAHRMLRTPTKMGRVRAYPSVELALAARRERDQVESVS